MKIVNYSTQSATLELSPNQLILLRDALCKVIEVVETEVELQTAISSSYEEAHSLKHKIEDLTGDSDSPFEKRIQFSFSELDSLRSLMVQIYYKAHLPMLSDLFESREQEVEEMMRFLASEVIPRMK